MLFWTGNVFVMCLLFWTGNVSLVYTLSSMLALPVDAAVS
jgi:hypothetical protein